MNSNLLFIRNPQLKKYTFYYYQILFIRNNEQLPVSLVAYLFNTSKQVIYNIKNYETYTWIRFDGSIDYEKFQYVNRINYSGLKILQSKRKIPITKYHNPGLTIDELKFKFLIWDQEPSGISKGISNTRLSTLQLIALAKHYNIPCGGGTKKRFKKSLELKLRNVVTI